MRYILLVLCWVLLFSVGCAQEVAVEKDVERYVAFSLNVQEFLFVEEGIETVNRVLDVHTEYGVPIEIFLTTTSVSIFEDEAPELFERFNSDLVSVSYHVRPPSPYYPKYEEELYETIVNYEEHALDLNTGGVLEDAGGYEHLKEIMGYAPQTVGMQTSSSSIARVFREKGVGFFVVHGNSMTPYDSGECLFIRENYNVGDKRYDVYVKPENVEIKLFQCLGLEIGEVIEDGFSHFDDTVFMNIKMHDNDFYSSKSAWTHVYLGKNRKGFGQEDFNYLDFKDESLLLSEESQEEMWSLYEDAVEYASQFNTINSFDI